MTQEQANWEWMNNRVSELEKTVKMLEEEYAALIKQIYELSN